MEINYMHRPILLTILMPELEKYRMQEAEEALIRGRVWTTAAVWARESDNITTIKKHLVSIEHDTTYRLLQRRIGNGGWGMGDVQ